MDLKKINKNNLSAMFYNHAKNVVKKYDNYVYQKEQLIFLEVMHELAVEHTLKIIQAIIKFDYDKNSYYYLRYKGNNDSVLKLDDFTIQSYEIEKDSILIRIKEHGAGTSSTMNIFKDKDKYRVYAGYNYMNDINFYELAIKDVHTVRKNGMVLNADIRAQKMLTIATSRNIGQKKAFDVLNIDNITKETDEFKYLHDTFSYILNDKAKLKDFLRKYMDYNGLFSWDYFYELNNSDQLDTYIYRADMHSSIMVYNLLFDAENMLAMMYDDMINNIDKYIKDSTDKDFVYKKESLIDCIYCLLGSTLLNHYEMLFSHMQIDINTLLEYNKTKDIVPIIKTMLNNFKKSNDNLKNISSNLIRFTFGGHSNLSQISDNKGLNIIFNGPQEGVMFLGHILRSILNDLVEGEDSMFNLLTTIILLDYDKYKNIKSINIIDDKEKSKVDLTSNAIDIFDEHLMYKIGDSLLSYNGNTWGKDTLDKLSEIIKS